LKTSISKAALGSGILVFLLILIPLFCGGGSFILLVIYGAPGLIYGLALTASAKNPVSALRGVFFVALSLVINATCVYYVSVDFLNAKVYAAFESVTFSTVSAVLLTMCYDLIILRRFSVFRTIAMPSILGIAASLFSALFIYFIVSGRHSEFLSSMLWAGMMSVFPLWQYLIGLNIDYHSRAVYPLPA